MPVALAARGVELTVCGLGELHGQGQRAVTHVLSILDPGYPDPTAFAAWDPHARETMRFHDIIEEYPGFIAPTREDVGTILAFGDTIHADGSDLSHLLIHCHAGISRSTAALATLLAAETPGDEEGVFARLRAIRAQAWPNSRMIGFADDLLGCGGRLSAALREHYRLQVSARPDLVEMIRSVGRDAEIPPG
ncbi:MAG: protein-tyrosine-phosphatase [Geminicoccaceae bacterium]